MGYESNDDGSLLSHMTVMVNQNGYPIDIKDEQEKKFVFVDE